MDRKDNSGHLIIVMGVSGSGKSTVGNLLAGTLNSEFFDADDFHPQENVKKLASGKPLNDADRAGWLERLNEVLLSSRQTGAVMACSALKERYRDILARGIGKENVVWVYLKGSYDQILERMKARDSHFMPSSLLRSQFDTLEIPDYAIAVNIGESPDDIVAEILSGIK